MAEKQPNVIIEPMSNGPLIVKGLKNLRDSSGKPVPMKKDTIALCRCGGSRTKPFCDGTHRTIGFSDRREIDKPLDRETAYRGKQITIFDNRTICSHAETCVRELPAVFRKNQRPWIDPEGASPEEVMALIRKCPSGALSYQLGDTHVRDFDREPAIEIARGGPYHVTGYIALKSDLQPPSREHYALCRCGASKNKPFCDGAHHQVAFEE